MALSDVEARAVYELSKVTNTTKIVMDDFIQSAVLAMFKEYILSYKDPVKALESFIKSWKNNIVIQKQLELEALTGNHESMSDLVVGNQIAEQEDIEHFMKCVDEVGDALTDSFMDAIYGK